MILDDFCNWLQNTTFASKPNSTSPKKYKGGVQTISTEMLNRHIIQIPLEEMTLEQLEIAIFNIFNDEYFIRKNSTGHNMYSNSLKHFRMFFKDSFSNMDGDTEELQKIKADASLKPTEKESLIKSRVGQGDFRNKILDKYNGVCIISGVSEKRLLIASHVKPWSISNNENRLSSENGLLLNALYDKMFDIGLITFSETGEILISKELSPSNLALTKIKRSFIYPLKYTPLLLENMEYHRDVVFLKG